jgi:hypothetical protein
VNTPLILILLPVYNGARYLPEQLNSLLYQTHQNLLILCRDDGSTDNSAGILSDYASRNPQRFSIVDDEMGNLGAAGNYSLLMEMAVAFSRQHTQSVCYVALSDQDDIWYPDKLQRTLQAMLAEEQRRPACAVLVHGNLRVVDAQAREIDSSFARYQGVKPQRQSLVSQWVSNSVTGCTALMNMALLEKALPIPSAAIMHDWWLSLVVSAFGARVYLPEPLLDYRQHQSNTIGAKSAQRKLWSYATLTGLTASSGKRENQEIFDGIARQTKCFMDRYGHELTPSTSRLAKPVCGLATSGIWRRRIMFRLLRAM